MGKELTNRQLAEAVGYALEKAEANLNDSVKKLEDERQRIESFSIDTNNIKALFDEANKEFDRTSRECINRLEKIKNNKPKEVEIKEWIYFSFTVLATLGSILLMILAIISKNDAQEENKKLKDIITNVDQYFKENTKAKEEFYKWNNKSNEPN